MWAVQATGPLHAALPFTSLCPVLRVDGRQKKSLTKHRPLDNETQHAGRHAPKLR